MKNNLPYILMLEDDSDDRHITQLFFLEKGYNVSLEFLTAAGEVLPYLDKCLTDNLPLPSLILLDKSASFFNGADVLKQIKSHPVLQLIPVVMISGSADQKDINESYRLGASSYITKPFNNELTAKTIDAFVNYWFGTVELPAVVARPVHEFNN